MHPVTLLGVDTPVVLAQSGPPVTEADVAAFEALLGRLLPADYREFLLTYNGGLPVVTLGEDIDGTEFMLSGLRSLHPDAMDEPYAAHLSTPARREGDYGWGLPADVLEIANDPGGNLFTLSLDDPAHTVRFIDHESDAPFGMQRVLARGFTAFLQLIRSVDAQAAIEADVQCEERRRLERGPFPAALDAQLRRVEAHVLGVRDAVRRACLAVFNDKAHFSLHDDPRSQQVFDLMLWVHETATAPGLTRAEMHEVVFDWFSDASGGFGLNGYAPGFLDDWWAARFEKGALEGDVHGQARFTSDARTALMTSLRTGQT